METNSFLRLPVTSFSSSRLNSGGEGGGRGGEGRGGRGREEGGEEGRTEGKGGERKGKERERERILKGGYKSLFKFVAVQADETFVFSINYILDCARL